ncbi:uncharacterized protein LOC133200843 [Saccostrea echinata]|uniref:uncharacterized protein LOC133200843 n=1 Tax=Saccostrea echinata TaxID=191078 RepID=UPI002A81E19E|nr:uncharacterized protein LOC133200843 [Saccostrea echinata]
MDANPSIPHQPQVSHSQQIECDLESCDLHPIQPVNVRLSTYTRHSSPSPLRIPVDGIYQSKADTATANEPLKSTTTSPRRPRYRMPKSHQISHCQILESSPTPLRLDNRLRYPQYLTRSHTRHPSPLTLMNLHLGSRYLTRSRVKLWKQKGKQPCPIHGKIIRRQLPRHQSTPKLQLGPASQNHQPSPVEIKARQGLTKIFSSNVQQRSGHAASYVPTPQRMKANPKERETTPRKKGLVTKIRKFASRVQKSVSKVVQRRQTIDVSDSSNVQQASDVQWVELNSRQKQNYFTGSTEDLDSSLPITCFRAKKVKVTKPNPSKAHIRRMMKEKQKRALSTPARAKRLSILQSPSKMPFDKPCDASVDTTTQQETNGTTDHNIVTSPVSLATTQRPSPKSEDQQLKVPPIIIKKTAVVTTKPSMETQKVPPIVISRTNTVVNPLTPPTMDSSSQESSCDSSCLTESSHASSQDSQEQATSASSTHKVYTTVPPRQRDYTWISPIIRSKVQRFVEGSTTELSSSQGQNLPSTISLPEKAPVNSQRQTVCPAIQIASTEGSASRQPVHATQLESSAIRSTMGPSSSATMKPLLVVSTSAAMKPLPVSSTSATTKPQSVPSTSATMKSLPVSSTSATMKPQSLPSTSATMKPLPVSSTSATMKPLPVPSASATMKPLPVQSTSVTMKPLPVVSSTPAVLASQSMSSTSATGRPQQDPSNSLLLSDTFQSALITRSNVTIKEEARNYLRYIYKFGKTKEQMIDLLSSTLRRFVKHQDTYLLILNHLIQNGSLTQQDVLLIKLAIQQRKNADASAQQRTNSASSQGNSTSHPSVTQQSSTQTAQMINPLQKPQQAQQLTHAVLPQRERTQQSPALSVPQFPQMPSQMFPSHQIPAQQPFQMSNQSTVPQHLPSQPISSQMFQSKPMNSMVQPSQEISVPVANIHTSQLPQPQERPSSLQIPHSVNTSQQMQSMMQNPLQRTQLPSFQQGLPPGQLPSQQRYTETLVTPSVCYPQQSNLLAPSSLQAAPTGATSVPPLFTLSCSVNHTAEPPSCHSVPSPPSTSTASSVSKEASSAPPGPIHQVPLSTTSVATQHPRSLLTNPVDCHISGSVTSSNQDKPTTALAMIIPSIRVHQSEQTLHDDIRILTATSSLYPKSKKRLFPEESAAEDTNQFPLKKRKISYLDLHAQNRAWTSASIKSNPDDCKQCDGINEILHETPENLDRIWITRPTERAPVTITPVDLWSLCSDVRGKPHLLAKRLVWRLFTVHQLYGNRFNSLDEGLTTKIREAVMWSTECNREHWDKKCVPFINNGIRYLFNEKLRKYEHLLNHTCPPTEAHMESEQPCMDLVPV